MGVPLDDSATSAAEYLSACSMYGGLPLVLHALHVVGRAPTVLACLVNDGRRKQFRRIELADRETIEPCLVAASEALKLRAPHVPQFDIDAVRAALTEQQNSHGWRV